MRIGFDPNNGQVLFVFETDELESAKQIVEMFDLEDEDTFAVYQAIDEWIRGQGNLQ